MHAIYLLDMLTTAKIKCIRMYKTVYAQFSNTNNNKEKDHACFAHHSIKYQCLSTYLVFIFFSIILSVSYAHNMHPAYTRSQLYIMHAYCFPSFQNSSNKMLYGLGLLLLLLFGNIF